MTTNYQQEAIEALAKCETEMIIKLKDNKKAIWEDKNESRERHHYQVTLKNSKGACVFDFFGSINDFEQGKEPSEYDILACLDYHTSNSFENFCADFGYDSDSRKTNKIWKSSLKQSNELRAIFTDEQIEILSQIR